MSVSQGILRISNKPMESIQGVIATSCFFFGLYVLSPFYVQGAISSISVVFSDSTIGRMSVGLFFFVLPALPTILGFFYERYRTLKWRSRSAFYMFVGISFLTCLRLITLGFTPLIWVFYLSLGIISAILYLYWKARDA